MGLNKLNHNFSYPLEVTSEMVPVLSAGTIQGNLVSPLFSGQALESFYISSAGFNGWTFYASSNGAIQYLTGSSTSNGVLNLTASPTQSLNAFMAVGQVITCLLMITNGIAAYYPTTIQIDGTAIGVKWSGGTAPAGGNASSIDQYLISIFKIGVNQYTIFGSQTKNA
jgi:hypothetical protein